MLYMYHYFLHQFLEHKIYYDRGLMFIETIDFDTTLNKLKKVLGIHAFLN